MIPYKPRKNWETTDHLFVKIKKPKPMIKIIGHKIERKYIGDQPSTFTNKNGLLAAQPDKHDYIYKIIIYHEGGSGVRMYSVMINEKKTSLEEMATVISQCTTNCIKDIIEELSK